MKRLFFALWPSDKTREQIDVLNQPIKSAELKKVKPENLHVTLVFLGNVEAETEQLIRQKASTVFAQPFCIAFEQLDFWQKPKVLCLTTKQYDSRLLNLANTLKAMVEQCGIKTEERPYRPHVTLARKAKFCEHLKIEPIEWLAQSFCLVESRSTSAGVRYTVIQSWRFN